MNTTLGYRPEQGITTARGLATKSIVAVMMAQLLCGQGCPAPPPGGNGGGTAVSGSGAGVVYMWLAADRDTYIWTGDFGIQDANWGDSDTLVVAFTQDGRTVKRSYINFSLPEFPAGTEVLEAYLNVYHTGANEDGQTDDVMIPVQRANPTWNPLTLTPDNEPIFGAGGEFGIDLRSQDWSGSENIAFLVQQIMADPDNFDGFVMHWQPFSGLQIEKGFASNNHRSRTATSMGLAPRLLVKFRLPDGFDTGDVVLPAGLPTDTDLGFAGVPVTVAQFAGGTDTWPSNWDVAIAGVP